MSRSFDDDGFSLIELLVVILIIAVLAAIAIPVYLRQREKAWQSQLIASLKNAATAAESYSVGIGNGGYTKPGSGRTFDLADLEGEGFKTTSPEVSISSLRGSRTAFCIEAFHLSLAPTKTMAISSEQTTPQKGRCSATNFQSITW